MGCSVLFEQAIERYIPWHYPPLLFTAAKWLRQIYTELLFSLSLLIFAYFYSNFTGLCEFLKRTTNLKLLDFCWFSTMLRQQLSPDTWRMSPNCAPVTCTHTELVSTQRLEITYECQHFEKVCKSSKCCPSFCWQEMSVNMVGRIWNRYDGHAVQSSLIKRWVWIWWAGFEMDTMPMQYNHPLSRVLN